MVRGLFLQFSLISAGVIQAAMQAEAAAWALSGTQKGPLVCGCSCPTKPKNGGIEKCPNMAVWICLDRETIGKRWLNLVSIYFAVFFWGLKPSIGIGIHVPHINQAVRGWHQVSNVARMWNCNITLVVAWHFDFLGQICGVMNPGTLFLQVQTMWCNTVHICTELLLVDEANTGAASLGFEGLELRWEKTPGDTSRKKELNLICTWLLGDFNMFQSFHDVFRDYSIWDDDPQWLIFMWSVEAFFHMHSSRHSQFSRKT